MYTKKYDMIKNMEDIYPMFRLCRLFLEEEVNWQKEDLRLNAILKSPQGTWTDDSIEMEVRARIVMGEGRIRDESKLVYDYIIKYYPQYTKHSEVFGTGVDIFSKDPNMSNVLYNVRKIIDNCSSKIYWFLEKKHGGMRLTSEGRFFASGPYLYIWRGIPINVGLINEYYGALGNTKFIIIYIASVLGALNLSHIKNFIVGLL